MPADLITIFCCSILGLMAHGARTRKWMEWILRCFILSFCLVAGISYVIGQFAGGATWGYQVSTAMGVMAFGLLFLPVRKLYSRVLTVVDGIASLRVLTGPIRHKMSALAAMVNIQVFQPTSIPHMIGLFCYLATFGLYLSNTNLHTGFEMPGIPLPFAALPVDQLFWYNFFGLVFVSLCGCGIMVSRKPKEVAARLGWCKPTINQVGIGLGLVVFSFIYDLLWSLYTHSGPQDMASKISAYNSTTFAASGGFGASVFLAFMTAVCAGIGEETLIRGALQPALGIVPAAFLHGILHAQFANAPMLILQVALWSCCMGIVRRFTNTTTTIIGHAGFNLVTTFLFAFNP